MKNVERRKEKEKRNKNDFKKKLTNDELAQFVGQFRLTRVIDIYVGSFINFIGTFVKSFYENTLKSSK